MTVAVRTAVFPVAGRGTRFLPVTKAIPKEMLPSVDKRVPRPATGKTADAETIARELNGVGQARAQAIVDYRNEYGAFQSTDELLNVTGIGKFILEANEQNILIESAH